MRLNFEIGNCADFYGNSKWILTLMQKMKNFFFIIFITFQVGVYAQPEKNAKWYKTAIQKLKLRPSSFVRDTLLVGYYYQLSMQPAMKFQVISAYTDSMALLSNKTGWRKGNLLVQSAMINLAILKQTAGLWDESEVLKLKVINYYRSINDSVALNYSMATWANSLWDIGKFDKSLKILQDCLPFAKSKNDANLLVNIYTNFGYNYISKKMYPEAHLFFEKTYNIRNEYFAQVHCNCEDSLNKLAEWKTNLIEAYLMNKQKEKAEKMIPWVENINNLYGGYFQKYYSYSRFTNSYIEIGEYKKAEKYGLKCEKFAKPLASRAHDLIVYTYLYKVYKGLGKNYLSLNYLEKLRKVESDIAIEQMNTKVTEFQLKYDTETQLKKINELIISQQSQTQKSLLAGLLILIGITGYIYWNYLKLLQKNKEISEASLKGQTTERRRVAIDLHDNLGSTISSIRWSLDAIDKSNMDKDEREVHQNLYNLLDKAYNDVRLLSHNLLPEEFEKQGLAQTLQSFVRKINKNGQVYFSLQIADGFGRVDNRIEFELYSISLELVNNIMKHSKATESIIELSRTNNQIEFIISDNGIGTFSHQSDGKGMRNIKARVESLNGSWEIQANENQGFRNKILIPV